MWNKVRTLCLLASLPTGLLADFSYQRTSKITGGAMAGMMKFAGAFSKQAREPIQSTVAVKGNRMATVSKERASIIDLDAETITEISFAKKTYTVMTFAEMKQMMEQMAQRAKDAPKQQSEQQPSNVETDFKLEVKETGEAKEIAGLQTKEVILTMRMDATDQQTGNKGAMVVTNDMWIAPEIAGYEELREFHKRMAAKMNWSPDSGMGGMMAARPDMARAMANLSKEVAKMKGVPVMTVTKMTGEGQPAAGQPGSTPAGTDGQTAAQQQSKPTPFGDALSGRFGGFRKKKQDSSPAPADSSPGSLMEMTTEMGAFSAAPVDPSKFEIPTGFKKVDARRGGQ
jgi:hypothetical protein